MFPRTNQVLPVKEEPSSQLPYHERSSEVHIILAPNRLEDGSLLTCGSTITVTPYNQRLPEWRKKMHANAKDDKWRNRFEFIAAGLSITVGIGGITSMIINADKHGGTYVYAFTLLTVIITIPLFFFEVALGQFTAKDPIQVFSLVPLAEGIGYTMMIYLFFESTRYNVWISIFSYYFSISFNIKLDPFLWELPWEDCSSSFNCSSSREQIENYLFHTVLDEKRNISDGPGSLRWPLVGCLAISWFLIYLGMMRKFKVIAKMMIFILPTIILTLLVMFFTLVFMPGAMQGLSFFFTPSMSEFLSYKMWLAALDHALYGFGLGTLILMGSYSRFQSPAQIDTLIICLIWYFTIMLYGMVMYCGIGAVAVKYDIALDDVITRGYHKIMVVSCQVLSLFSFPPIWSVFLFLMNIIIGMSTLVFFVLILKQTIYTLFPSLHKQDALFSLALIVLLFLSGLIFVTQGSSYLLKTMSSGVYPPKIIIALELITFIFGYGLQRLRDDLEFMLHYNPSRFYRYLWVITLIVLIPVNIYQLAITHAFDMPPWVAAFALVLMSTILLPIPLVAIYKLIHFYRIGDIRGVLRPYGEKESYKSDHFQHSYSDNGCCPSFFRQMSSRIGTPFDSQARQRYASRIRLYVTSLSCVKFIKPTPASEREEEERQEKQLQRDQDQGAHRLGVMPGNSLDIEDIIDLELSSDYTFRPEHSRENVASQQGAQENDSAIVVVEPMPQGKDNESYRIDSAEATERKKQSSVLDRESDTPKRTDQKNSPARQRRRRRKFI